MAFTSPMTAVTGATFTAAQFNTHVRDNLNALWVVTAAGDIVYATGSDTLARLAKPSVDSLLEMGSSGVPSWLAKTAIGGIHAKGYTDFFPDQTFNSTWADITDASVTLSLSATCTVIVHAEVLGYNVLSNYGNRYLVRGVIDGTADDADTPNGMGTWPGGPVNQTLSYTWWRTGITSGSRVCKLQCEKWGTNNYVTSGRLMALAFVEN